MSDTNTTSFDARIVLRERNLDETIDLTLSYLRSAFKDFVRPILLSSGSALAVTLTLGLWLDLHWGQRIALAIFATSVSERMITVHAGQHLFRNHGSIAMTAKTVLRHLPAVPCVHLCGHAGPVAHAAHQFRGTNFGFGLALRSAFCGSSPWPQKSTHSRSSLLEHVPPQPGFLEEPTSYCTTIFLAPSGFV